jgi:hypothetical protein
LSAEKSQYFFKERRTGGFDVDFSKLFAGLSQVVLNENMTPIVKLLSHFVYGEVFGREVFLMVETQRVFPLVDS